MLRMLATSEDIVYANRFREARFRRFLAIVDEIVATRSFCRIVDLGGVAAYWRGLHLLWRDKPVHITLVNIRPDPTSDDCELTSNNCFECVIGDIRDLSQLHDFSFDIVHSNSVIEHVGTLQDQQRMAGEVRRLAPRYFVQTPNSLFPLEPHFRMPFIHWLPESWRAKIVTYYACGFYPRAQSTDDVDWILHDARLLDAHAMNTLFPDATIERERYFGLTKSLIAVR